MTNSSDDRDDAFPRQLRKFQCFLIENWRDFTAYNLTNSYNNFLKLTTNDPQMTSVRIMNNLTGTRSIESLNNLDPEYLGILVPELRLYRADIISDEWTNTEFKFPNFTNPDISQMLSNSNQRYPGAGIKSFDIENSGNNEVETTASLQANLELHLTSLNELEKSRGTVEGLSASTRTLRITDLMARPRGREEANFRIKAVVGWSMPSNLNIPEEKKNQLRDYVNRSRKTYTLTPVKHTIDLNEDGSVRISCEYVASVDAALRGDNPSPTSSMEYELMGVLQGALEPQDLQRYLAERISIIRRQEYIDCQERQANAARRRAEGGTGDEAPSEADTEQAEEREETRESLDQRSARNKGLLYNKFIEALLKQSAVHYIDLTGTELGLPSALTNEQLLGSLRASPNERSGYRLRFIEQEEARIRESAATPEEAEQQITTMRSELPQFAASGNVLSGDSDFTSPTGRRYREFLDQQNALRAQETGAAQAQQLNSSVAVVPQEGETVAQALEASTATTTALNARIRTYTLEQIESNETSIARLDPARQRENIISSELESNADAAQRNLQSLGDTESRESGKYRVHFIYLGDLINLGLQYFRHSSIPFELKKLMPIVAPAQIFALDSSATREQVNLADIPISLENIQSWFLNKIVATGRETIEFSEWMRLISNNLLKQASGRNCVEEGEVQTTRTLSLSVETVASPHPTLYTSDLSESDGINITAPYEPITSPPTMTAQQSLDSKNYLFIHSPAPAFGELSYFSSQEDPANETRRQRDASLNIFHLVHGARKGIVKSVKYTKRENGPLTDSNIITASQQRNGNYGAIDVEPYNASIRLYGNSYFTPMNIVKISPSFYGNQTTRLLRNISGYYSILKVRSIIEPGKFETELDCIWMSPEVSRREDAPNIESGQENNENCGDEPATNQQQQQQPSVEQVDRNIREQTGIQVDRPTGGAPVLRPRSGRGRQF